MNPDQSDVPAQQLVIVRRRRSGEEAHHGGAWKIAYADFMTAMMAFFLVMWLVNAADKKTIVQVAAYFNPLHLTDRTAATRGLEDQTEKAPSDHKVKKSQPAAGDDSHAKAAAEATKDTIGKPSPEKAAEKADAKLVADEQAMLADPQQALTSIAGEAKPRRQPRQVQDGKLRDPFDPAIRANSSAGAPNSKMTAAGTRQAQNGRKQQVSEATAPDHEEMHEAPVKEDRQREKKEILKPAESTAQGAATLAAQIASAVAESVSAPPLVETKAVPEGILITIADGAPNGMFEVGSAKPKPDTVVLLAKIGELLKTRPGKLMVRGHTDGRAYRGGIYDNWRLSGARAHMAMQMLIRGGVPEEQFLGVEGRADKDLKIKGDKDDPQNRRIEILLKENAL